MIKKFFMILVLASLVAGGVFAQNGSFDLNSGPTPQKSVLFVDLGYTLLYLLDGGFGIGAGWESRINDSSSWLISGGFGLYEKKFENIGYKYNAFEFSVEGNYRYYILKSALDKLFINVGVGYGGYSWSYSYDSSSIDDKKYSFGSLNIPLYAGWKMIIGPGFVAEIDAGYRIGIGIIKPEDFIYTYPTYSGIITGIRLGWAF